MQREKTGEASIYDVQRVPVSSKQRRYTAEVNAVVDDYTMQKSRYCTSEREIYFGLLGVLERVE